MSENGSQPTSVGFMKACDHLGTHQAFTSYNNPKGNADNLADDANAQGRSALAWRMAKLIQCYRGLKYLD